MTILLTAEKTKENDSYELPIISGPTIVIMLTKFQSVFFPCIFSATKQCAKPQRKTPLSQLAIKAKSYGRFQNKKVRDLSNTFSYQCDILQLRELYQKQKKKKEKKAYTDRFRLCKLDIQDLSQRFLNVLNVLP